MAEKKPDFENDENLREVLGQSEGGSMLYTYNEPKEHKWKAPAHTKYIEEIEEHMKKLSPTSETVVFHEIISDLIHIDVGFVKQSEKDGNFNILYTEGMSAFPMTLGRDISHNDMKELQYAELVMFLPKDWDLGKELSTSSDIPNENYWPVETLKFLARFPHKYKTFLGNFHTIPNGPDYEHFAENTDLSSVILVYMNDNVSRIKTKDDRVINLYAVVPLYKEECEMKLKKGAEYVLNKIMKLNPKCPWMLDIKRKNVAKSSFF